MRKSILAVLSLWLAGCAALAPVAPQPSAPLLVLSGANSAAVVEDVAFTRLLEAWLESAEPAAPKAEELAAGGAQ